MSDATKKTATKKTAAKKEAPAEAEHKEAAKEPAAKKAAPKKSAEGDKGETVDKSEKVGKADKEIDGKEAGKGVKGKGTSTKGPTKSSPGSKTEPKAKPDQQPRSAFSKPLTPSKELSAVIGASDPLPRTAVVSKVWAYIKEHKLQNVDNKKEILADEKLRAIFEKDKVSMFEMNRYFNAHLK